MEDYYWKTVLGRFGSPMPQIGIMSFGSCAKCAVPVGQIEHSVNTL